MMSEKFSLILTGTIFCGHGKLNAEKCDLQPHTSLIRGEDTSLIRGEDTSLIRGEDTSLIRGEEHVGVATPHFSN